MTVKNDGIRNSFNKKGLLYSGVLTGLSCTVYVFVRFASTFLLVWRFTVQKKEWKAVCGRKQEQTLAVCGMCDLLSIY